MYYSLHELSTVLREILHMLEDQAAAKKVLQNRLYCCDTLLCTTQFMSAYDQTCHTPGSEQEEYLQSDSDVGTKSNYQQFHMSMFLCSVD